MLLVDQSAKIKLCHFKCNIIIVRFENITSSNIVLLQVFIENCITMYKAELTSVIEGMYSYVTMYKAELLHLQQRECIAILQCTRQNCYICSRENVQNVMLQCTRQNCYTCCRGNAQLCYNVQGRTVTPVVEGMYSYVTMYKAELLHLQQRECIVQLQCTRQNCYICSKGNVQLYYNIQGRTVTSVVEGMYSLVTMYKTELLHLQQRKCIVMSQCTRQNCYICSRGNYSLVTSYKAELLHLQQRECIVMLQCTRQHCYTCSRGNVQLCYNVKGSTVTPVVEGMYSYVTMYKAELLHLQMRQCIVMLQCTRQNCYICNGLNVQLCHNVQGRTVKPVVEGMYSLICYLCKEAKLTLYCQFHL